jgi:hypothetical protein
MTTKSIATLEAINKGAGKDLPIAADLTAVLKAAKVYNVIIGAVNTSKKAYELIATNNTCFLLLSSVGQQIP